MNRILPNLFIGWRINMKAHVLKWQEPLTYRPALYDEIIANRLASNLREEQKRQDQKIQHFLEAVPKRFRGKKMFSDYSVTCPEQCRAKVVAERYVSTFQDRLEEGTCMVFRGTPGTGKTMLSFIMYQALAQLGYSVHYESSLEFLKANQDNRSESYINRQNSLEHCKRVQFLILDEVTESASKDGCPSEYERQTLSLLINARYQNNYCTLVITNRDKNELTHRLGSPIIDRLSEKGITLIFNWNSFRQK